MNVRRDTYSDTLQYTIVYRYTNGHHKQENMIANSNARTRTPTELLKMARYPTYIVCEAYINLDKVHHIHIDIVTKQNIGHFTKKYVITHMKSLSNLIQQH